MDLSNLKKETTNRPPRILLYGTPKIGKSTFGSQAPNPIFFDLEDGLDGIDSVKKRMYTFQEILDGIEFLATKEHGYETLVIDTLSQVQTMIYEAVCAENKVTHIEAIGYGKGYAFAVNKWQQLLEWLTALRNNKNMMIILIAHDEIKKFADPTSDSYDFYKPLLREQYCDMVLQWADAILFAQQKAQVKKEIAGIGKVNAKAQDGGRVLHTVEQPSFIAGHRTSLGLPDEIEFGYNFFIEALGTKGK